MTFAVPGNHGQVALPFGRFYGMEDIRRSGPGLELSLLRADPHRVVERHSHDEAHFVLVLDGLYVSTADGAPPVSTGPQLIFNPAGTTHRDRFEARNREVDGRFMTISLSSDTMREAERISNVPQRAVVLDSPQAMAVGAQLSRACAANGPDAAFTQHSLALELLSLTSVRRDPKHRGAPAWLRMARERLDDSLGNTSSIAEIARITGVHPVHLSRVFRQHVGMSPAHYLRQRRLEQSCALLRYTTRSLSDVALTCGFSDQSHFTNTFSSAYRITPSAFRALHRQTVRASDDDEANNSAKQCTFLRTPTLPPR